MGVAVVANLLTRALLFALLDLPADFPPLEAGAIAIFTTIGVALGVVAFAIVARIAEQPARTYTVVAVAALIISILPNLALAANPANAPFPGGTATAFMALIVFHVVAAAVAIIILTQLTFD